MRGGTAIVGVATAGIGASPGYNSLELMAQAVSKALDDCSLSLSDVNGLYVSSVSNAMPTVSAAEYLGIQPRHAAGTFIGGSAFVGSVIDAALALEAGLCDVALIAYGSNQRSAGGKLQVISETQPYEKDYLPQYPLSSYAMTAARHMYEFGTTRAQMAEVAVAARQWAMLNPDAFRRDPLTVADVVGAPLLAPPLGTKDACLVTDGAAAAIMVRADRARDFPHRAAFLLGSGTGYSHRQIAQAASLTTTAASLSGPRAFAMAGLKPADIDVVQLYDAFTINPILFLEDLGFCAKGEGGAFVENGAIAPGGRLPVNTNGGGLSCVHPGLYGLFLIVEAVEQLRGSAGTRQVADARTALCHGNGGVFSTQMTAIFGTEEVL